MDETVLDARYENGQFYLEDHALDALFSYYGEESTITVNVFTDEQLQPYEVYDLMDQYLEEHHDEIMSKYREETRDSRIIEYMQTGIGLLMGGIAGLVYYLTRDTQSAMIALGASALALSPIDFGLTIVYKDAVAKKAEFNNRLKKLEEHNYSVVIVREQDSEAAEGENTEYSSEIEELLL